jgi:hypothetical protein
MGPWELPETRGGMSRRNRRYSLWPVAPRY